MNSKIGFILLCLCLYCSGFAQKSELKLESTIELVANEFVGIDKFDNVYYIKNNTLFKTTPANEKIAYQDILLGDILRVDILNPNKISVFYSLSNVVIILDNRLTEIDRQDFNYSRPFKNVSHAGTSKDQSLWIYNIDLNQLELFDYRYDKTIAKSVPISDEIFKIENNFNYCFLKVPDGILIYNIYGSFIKKVPISSPFSFNLFKNKLIAHHGDELMCYGTDFEITEIIKVDFEDYKSLFYKDENLYLYNGNILKKYKISPKN